MPSIIDTRKLSRMPWWQWALFGGIALIVWRRIRNA
jgi:hypothetical protein